MKRGDIIEVDFPFTNFRDSKRRMAIIISSDEHNDPDCVLAFITSKDYRDPLDFNIQKEHPEFKKTGLCKASTFRLGKIVTCHSSLIHSKVGNIGPEIQKEIGKRLKLLFKL